MDHFREIIEPPLVWMRQELQEMDPSFKFNLIFKDSECSREGIIKLADGMKSKKDAKYPRAFLGPVCPYAAQFASYYGNIWNIPVITPGANSPGFDDDDEYTTLVRVLPTFDDMTLFIFDVFEELGYIKSSACYYNIFVVWEDDDDDDEGLVHYYYHMIDSISEYFRKRDIKPGGFISADAYSKNISYADMVEKIGPGMFRIAYP